ncbi:MAG: murein biosynthesis integral membrane protein MurJ [Gemmatimonadaceae bacterium]|nr:murein biosynthesis integral membrane protein MurJ [Gemmatimonadaceae bacterium]
MTRTRMSNGLSKATEALPDSSGSRSASVVFAGILISRILGLVRTTLFARYFGNGAYADAFNTAFKIPNAVRNLLGEGTLSASFVPVYSRMLAKSDAAGARALAAAVLGFLLAGVSVLTLLGIVAAPWLTAVLAPGFDPARAELTTRLTRVLFPMTGLMVVSGWCLGVQNSHRRFFWSYASAALWSAAQIVLLAWWGKSAESLSQLAWWLAWATLVGSVLQVGAQLPEIVRLVGVLRPTLDRRAEGLTQTLRNIGPVIVALGVVQISSLIDLQIASFLPEGAVSSISYASLIALLPVSLFGVSVAASSLPEFSRDSGTAREGVLLERLRGGWQRILFYIIPCAVVFLVFGDLCVGILLRNGRFGPDEQQAVRIVLAGSAIGLISFSSVKLLASAYYALQDYRTPLRASVSSLLVSAVVAASLAYPFRHEPWGAAAITLGSALGSFVNLAVLVRGLRARLGALYTGPMWVGSRRIVLAALLAVLAALPVRFWVRSLHPMVGGPPTLAVFGVAYLAAAWWMGSREASRLLRLAPRA